MRFYGFGNYYLSSIQQGIQAFHVGTDISVKYGDLTDQKSIYDTWALNYKTVILCNGGNADSLKGLDSLFSLLEMDGMDLPYSKFNEDEQSLNGALTSVGIVLRTHHYEFVEDFSPNKTLEDFAVFIKIKDWETYTQVGKEFGYADWELKLMFEISQYPLAK